MIKKLSGEIWKPVKLKNLSPVRNKYAISSHGRAASYRQDILDDGKLLSGSLTSGYRTLNLHFGDSSTTLYLHREVAKLFNGKPSSKQKFVLHINHDKTDNRAKNLKWATQQEVNNHQQKSPKKLEYKKVQSNRTRGLKLNAVQVKAIKSILANPRRKLTHQQIADKFNISPMTVYRIKSGENWADIS
jgi:hypothetical protein